MMVNYRFVPKAALHLICHATETSAHRQMPACSANSAQSYCFTHVVAGNGFDRVSAGRRTAIGGKRVREGGFSGQCAVIRRRFRSARHEKWTDQPVIGDGRGHGCLESLKVDFCQYGNCFANPRQYHWCLFLRYAVELIVPGLLQLGRGTTIRVFEL